MTAAMFDQMYEDNLAVNPAAQGLRPGTLVYLWRPGETPWAAGSRPVLARVEQGRAHCIVAIDLVDNARAIYDVISDMPGLRWQWEVAAPPQSPVVDCSGVEIVEAPGTLEDRTRFVAGEPGDRLQVRLRSGEVLWGTLQKLVMGQDAWEAEWAELVDVRPGSDAQVHVIRVRDVAGVTRFRRA